MEVPDTIVVVDVQEGFISEASAFVPGAIEAFLAASDIRHRYFTRFRNPGAGGQFADLLGWNRMTDPADCSLVDPPATRATTLVDKTTYSPLLDSGLVEQLHGHDALNILVCGIDTDVCVLMTAAGLFDLGFRPIVVTDLCMSHGGQEFHDAAVRILPRMIGRDNVVTTAEVETWG